MEHMNSIRFTRGTEGAANYGIVARRGNVMLSVRPLGVSKSTDDLNEYHYRLRASYDGAAFEDVSTEIVHTGYPATAFPNFNFEKNDGERASKVTSFHFASEEKLFANDMIAMAAHLIGTAIDAMADGGQIMVTSTELTSFLHKRYEPMVAEMVDYASAPGDSGDWGFGDGDDVNEDDTAEDEPNDFQKAEQAEQAAVASPPNEAPSEPQPFDKVEEGPKVDIEPTAPSPEADKPKEDEKPASPWIE